MDATALSLAARQLREYLALQLPMDEGNILIGHPSAAYKEADNKDGGDHYLNLFFYRVEPGGYPADAASDDPIYIRIHCLITSLATKDTGGSKVSAGENDLRMVGGVVASLHTQPFMQLQNEDGDEVAHLQIVMHPMSLDDLNHIWSTQGEIAYRPSVAYELALAPVPLTRRVDRSPRVVESTPEVTTNMSEAGEVEPWQPAIAFLLDGQLSDSLRYATGAVPAEVTVAAAGKVGEEISFFWEQWENMENGWQEVELDPLPNMILSDEVLDSGSATINLALPVAAAGQAMLYAVRQWQRSDGSIVPLRSNPLLIVVHGGT